MRQTIAIALATVTLLAQAACGSHDSTAADAATDENLLDRPRLSDRRVFPERIVLPDALADMPPTWDATRPQGVHYDFCDQPIWQIPHDDSVTRDIYFDSLSGTDLFYRVHTSGRPPRDDIYYFDISTCTEYLLNSLAPAGIELAGVPGTGSRRAVLFGWNESGDIASLWLLNLDTWQMRLLFTDQPGRYVYNSQSNGTILGALFTEDVNRGPGTVHILNLDTNDATDVWSGPLAFSYMAVTDSFVLFEREVTDPACTSMAITHFVDLQDLSQADIPDTCVKSQHRFIGSGRRIGYMEAQGMLPAPYTCVVMDMDTHQKWVLTQDDQTDCLNGMDGHIVSWSTSRYGTNGQMTDLIGDLMVADLDRNTERRLTSQAIYGFIAHPIALPWAVFFIPRGNYYVINLQALGVVDEQGHLIEGPPIEDLTLLGLP